jgi:hypothetical protein
MTKYTRMGRFNVVATSVFVVSFPSFFGQGVTLEHTETSFPCHDVQGNFILNSVVPTLQPQNIPFANKTDAFIALSITRTQNGPRWSQRFYQSFGR